MKYEEIVAEQISEGFVEDVFSGINKELSGIKGKVKKIMDSAREVKHYNDRGEPPYGKAEKILLLIGEIESIMKELGHNKKSSGGNI